MANLADGRKLRVQSSHPESPCKKSPCAEASEPKVPSSDEDAAAQKAATAKEDSEEMDVHGMFKSLMQMMESVKTEVTEVKESTHTALDNFKSQVQEDLTRIETKVGNTQAQLESLQAEVKDLKTKDSVPAPSSSSVHARAQFFGPVVNGSTPGSAAQRRPIPPSWKPTKVVVYNFCPFGSDAGALTRKERDENGALILSKLSQEVAKGVTLEKKYSLSRQLVFEVNEGGEACWILREAILGMQNLEIKGFQVPNPDVEPSSHQEHLKVRVEDHPERKEKRGHFFRALRALEKQFPHDSYAANQIIVDVRFLKLHAGPQHSSLGPITASGWTWDADACANTLGTHLDLPRLRRDSLRDEQ